MSDNFDLKTGMECEKEFKKALSDIRSATLSQMRCRRQRSRRSLCLHPTFMKGRDGSTGGFFGDNVQAGQQVWDTVNLLLRLDRDWKV